MKRRKKIQIRNTKRRLTNYYCRSE